MQKQNLTNKVYLIRETGSQCCKIGLSCMPKSRFRDLCAVNAHALELICTYESRNAELLESLLHKHYKTYLLHDEWFCIPGMTADIFIDACQEIDGDLPTNASKPFAIYNHITLRTVIESNGYRCVRYQNGKVEIYGYATINDSEANAETKKGKIRFFAQCNGNDNEAKVLVPGEKVVIKGHLTIMDSDGEFQVKVKSATPI